MPFEGLIQVPHNYVTGQLVRVISHWTAGAGRASALDLQHYHYLTEMDGNCVPGKEDPEDNIVTGDGDYAAHTLRMNSGSIGVACCGMRGAVESPFDPGPSPITEVQFEAHCRMIAEICHAFGIAITDRTVLFHGEVQGTLGVRQRGKWDMNRLPFKLELRGARACGDYMRSRVRHYAGEATGAATTHMPDRPTLYKGIRGSLHVQDLQTTLKELGYQVGAVDGTFGGITKRAVQAFQSDRGLVPDGAVGPITWDALYKAMASPAAKVKVPHARKNSTMAELRAKGSSTVERGDKAQVTTASALGLLGVGEPVSALLSGIEDQVERATAIKDRVSLLAGEGVVSNAVAWAATNWHYVLGAALLLAALGYVQQTKESRLDDHREGRNLGR